MGSGGGVPRDGLGANQRLRRAIMNENEVRPDLFGMRRMHKAAASHSIVVAAVTGARSGRTGRGAVSPGRPASIGLRDAAGERPALRRLASLGAPRHFQSRFCALSKGCGAIFNSVVMPTRPTYDRRPHPHPPDQVRGSHGPPPARRRAREDRRRRSSDGARPARLNRVICLEWPLLVQAVLARRLHAASFGR